MRRSLSLFALAVLTGPAWGQSAVCDVTEGAPLRLQGRSAVAPAFPPEPPLGPPLQDPDPVWIETALGAMTLEEKIGQLLMPGINPGGWSPGAVQSWIDNLHIGGIIYFGNGQSAADVVATSNQLQGMSPFPLLVAIDAEAGLGARVADATTFPLIMAFGAADDPTLTEACGGITARECRALGVHVAFGPVVDVNTEPLNPIISTRSYGDDPAPVAELAEGFIAGARAEGLLCTFKHYPGHGATAGDSHSSLPTVDIPMEEILSDHISPYSALAASGNVDLVMTAHVWFSQVHPGTPWPATLSSVFLADILRGDIGYEGLVISDAYGMQGLAIAVPDERERAVQGIEAGLDVILLPPDPAEAFAGILAAVQSDRVSEERIDESVRRVLALKSRVGLADSALVDPALHTTVLQHPSHEATVRAVCEAAFTCWRNDLPSSPILTPESDVVLLRLSATQRIFYLFSSEILRDALQAEIPSLQDFWVTSSVDDALRSAILAEAAGADAVIVSGRDWYRINSADQVDLINDLCALETPVVYVGFGAPYHALQIPDVDALFCGYASVPAMQEVAAEVLLGERTARGTLPVEVEGFTGHAILSGALWR